MRICCDVAKVVQDSVIVIGNLMWLLLDRTITALCKFETSLGMLINDAKPQMKKKYFKSRFIFEARYQLK